MTHDDQDLRKKKSLEGFDREEHPVTTKQNTQKLPASIKQTAGILPINLNLESQQVVSNDYWGEDL